MNNKPTVAQAARELNTLARKRLVNGLPDQQLVQRIAQFTEAVDAAITDLQQQVRQLQGRPPVPASTPARR